MNSIERRRKSASTSLCTNVEPVFDPEPFVEDKDFWILDAHASYRLPHRRGVIALLFANFLDEDSPFQETDFNKPLFFPERTVLLRLSLSL